MENSSILHVWMLCQWEYQTRSKKIKKGKHQLFFGFWGPAEMLRKIAGSWYIDQFSLQLQCFFQLKEKIWYVLIKWNVIYLSVELIT